MNDVNFMIDQNNKKPTEPPPALISEYVHGLRVIPAGEPKSGVLDVNYMPQLIEPMDCMGPYSGVNIVSFMKSVQSGVTFNCAENVSAYYIGANPKQQLYVTATLSLLDKWASTRLDPMLISCGLKEILTLSIGDNEIGKKSRRTPDRMYSKQYPGGALSMTSLESPAGLRSESKQIVIIDEIDGAKATLSTGEGSSVEVVHGRAAAFGSRGKFMEFSTPTTFDRSIIYKRYLMGDQRKYMVPCPLCGVFQVLEFKQLQPEFDKDGALESVWYQCPESECEGKINNWDKTEMLRLGYWEPTATPSSKGHRSYHINTLYNPVGMMDWQAVYQKYLTAQENPPEFMPPFTNNYLGLPYKEEGHRPDIKKVIKHRGGYKRGTVPNGVLYLVEASDVQRGAERYQEMSPEELDTEIARIRETKGEAVLWKSKIPRIETEIMGQGADYRTWSVDYFVTYGHTTMGSYMGAFARMDARREEGGMTYKRDDGREFVPVVKFMDASDGVTQSSVFDICSRWRNAFPNINDGWLKKKKDPGVDESSRMNFDRYRLDNKGRNIHISTNYYKKRLYTSLNLPRNNLQEMQPPGFSEFPRDYEDHYFKMLTGFEALNDDSFSDGGRPVEAGDCRVYCLCASDFWLEAELKKERDKAKGLGLSEIQVKQYDKPWLLRKIGKVVEVRPAL